MKFSKTILPGEKLSAFLESSLNSLQSKCGSVVGQRRLRKILKKTNFQKLHHLIWCFFGGIEVGNLRITQCFPSFPPNELK
ncbi:hypothetical protein BpHYR1_014229 [Brachionus plicatilis]|uniref:Uncharacterized protein n=1 Tax=Brachionus plicatilis TaxID=10195 RepID=A0A3M7SC51_BRAPC|nr:hypothetical protein BpHYR1_014229 [Brachionus plicatilis]